MRRKQLHTFDHPLRLVIERTNPHLGSKLAMIGCPVACRMLGMHAGLGRTVTASDVPTLRTPAEMKPPTFSAMQTFHDPSPLGFEAGLIPPMIFLHFDFSFPTLLVEQRVQATSRICPATYPFLRLLSLGRLSEWQFLANRDYKLANLAPLQP